MKSLHETFALAIIEATGRKSISLPLMELPYDCETGVVDATELIVGAWLAAKAIMLAAQSCSPFTTEEVIDQATGLLNGE